MRGTPQKRFWVLGLRRLVKLGPVKKTSRPTTAIAVRETGNSLPNKQHFLEGFELHLLPDGSGPPGGVPLHHEGAIEGVGVSFALLEDFWVSLHRSRISGLVLHHSRVSGLVFQHQPLLAPGPDECQKPLWVSIRMAPLHPGLGEEGSGFRVCGHGAPQGFGV